MSIPNKKDHADFQDPYRRSSNVPKTIRIKNLPESEPSG